MSGGISHYAKFIVAVIGATLTVAIQELPTELESWRYILTIANAGITAIAVYVVPNVLPEDTERGKHVRDRSSDV